MTFHSTRFEAKARYDAAPLTEDQMRTSCPSIFAETPHSSRSERFRAIPTIDVLRGLKREGFEPFAVKQCIVRHDDRKNFTKHLIRLRQRDAVKTNQVNDTIAEIVLKNANDGTAAYDLLAGLFKIKCLNGMVTQTESFEPVKVRHSGDVTSKVIEGTFKVLGEARMALSAPLQWSQLKLEQEESKALAEAAHVLRFGDATGAVTTAIRPEQLLEARRASDRMHDLWTTFNVVQENVIRGGLHGQGPDANGRIRRVTTREIHGIDQDVKLNKALWVLAARMAQLKAA
jgi:hypothetical protein